jgi:mitochondrial import inner membrane translocase subunit TIM21
MYTEVFALDSKTNWFNRAVDRVKADSQVQELLGDPKKIIAYGEKTNNKWAVARPIA